MPNDSPWEGSGAARENSLPIPQSFLPLHSPLGMGGMEQSLLPMFSLNWDDFGLGKTWGAGEKRQLQTECLFCFSSQNEV